MGKAYTGDGSRLHSITDKNNDFKLIGLEEGIVRTFRALL